MSLKVSVGGAHSQPPGRLGALPPSACPCAKQWEGGLAGGGGPPPPFSLCSVSFSQDGEGSSPVMLMCLFALQPWETSVALVRRGWVLSWGLLWP